MQDNPYVVVGWHPTLDGAHVTILRSCRFCGELQSIVCSWDVCGNIGPPVGEWVTAVPGSGHCDFCALGAVDGATEYPQPYAERGSTE